MPRSRSSSLLSIARSATRSLARNVPLWCRSASTSVVLPWSTCAMMATLRREGFATDISPVYRGVAPDWAVDSFEPFEQGARALAELGIVSHLLRETAGVVGTR